MREIRYLRAVIEALEQEMARDKNVFVMGEDVRLSVKGATTGLVDKFGSDRVIDTPISEQALCGSAIGAAIMGFRPVIEFHTPEFVFFAFDQLVDQAQKLRYMSGGRLKIPITYLVTGSGAGGSSAAQHSDHAYPYVLQGGMKVIIPSTPFDVKGLLIGAIRDDDPVMVFLPARILAMKGDVPEDIYSIPLGSGEVKHQGKDVTVVATGHLVQIAVNLAKKLEADGISIEIFDPRSLLPLDLKMLKESVKKTGRVVIFDDSNKKCGFASDVAAILAEECFSWLKAPVKRIARADVPVPFSPPLENYMLPNEEKLISSITNVLRWR
ncbi:MAG: alpha-ketoacid dehydrogenase subunit beta [Actinobacteria bacterium]|nr:alpha-ketoacid dehydrogenase subunit beta [Actinomycetota bacterium]